MIRCLVVDDMRHNRAIAVHWLAELGHATLEASDGSEAWKLILAKSLDLVITDIEMPLVSGLELLQQLRNHDDERVANIPVIVMSSLQDGMLEETVLSFGASMVVRKPLTKVGFQKAVAQVLGKRANGHQCTDDGGDPPEAYAPGMISPTLRRLINKARDTS